MDESIFSKRGFLSCSGMRYNFRWVDSTDRLKTDTGLLV